MENQLKLIGPFKQIVTLANLPLHGPIKDHQLEVIEYGAILVDRDVIHEVGKYQELKNKIGSLTTEPIQQDLILLPGFIDAHTHLCYAGSRAVDFAKRLAGESYQDIAREGGGIWQTVTDTRAAPATKLNSLLQQRAVHKLKDGVTTVEVKSGYGLNFESEIKMLRCIGEVNKIVSADLVPTCLAAHITPQDYQQSARDYLAQVARELLPVIKEQRLARRVDIFIEENAFSRKDAGIYLNNAKQMGFDLVVHADQFTRKGSVLAAKLRVLSADHLEVSRQKEIQALIENRVICTVLPGASIGLGVEFAPARLILDQGGCLVIASDQNPGSAPHGDLLTLASILATFEKLTTAEVFAGITFRAAAALRFTDRGVIKLGYKADFLGFRCDDFREILYQQGTLKPACIWKNGTLQDFTLNLPDYA